MSGHCSKCGWTVCVCDEIAVLRRMQARRVRSMVAFGLVVLLNLVVIAAIVWLLLAAIGGGR